ncbi:phage tail protein [Brevundimonas nasdae]|uniref:phage tail protein n=1 Tax=Brevundimonas nasdae TaxID=172043 RepID=UPI003F68E936
MMMALGMFVFSLPTLAYQDLQRKSAWRHPEQSRVGARPASQFVGPEAEKITLSGVLAPEVSGRWSSLKDLRAMGDDGGPWSLVTGTGEVLGSWVIESLDTTETLFFEDGVARRADFTLSLKQVDDPAQAVQA